MSLFWTHHAAAGAFTEEAKPFVTYSPGSANSIEFLACSCTDPKAHRAHRAHRAHSCWQHLKHCQAHTDLVAKGCFLSLVPSPQTPALPAAAQGTVVSAWC